MEKYSVQFKLVEGRTVSYFLGNFKTFDEAYKAAKREANTLKAKLMGINIKD